MSMNKSSFLGFGVAGLAVPTEGVNVLFVSPVGGVTIRNSGGSPVAVVLNMLLMTSVGPDVAVTAVFPAGTPLPTSLEFRRNTIAAAGAYAFVIPAGGIQHFNGYSQHSAGPLIRSIGMWGVGGASTVNGGQDDVTVA